jgi:PAS domain S-box-containing protein
MRPQPQPAQAAVLRASEKARRRRAGEEPCGTDPAGTVIAPDAPGAGMIQALTDNALLFTGLLDSNGKLLAVNRTALELIRCSEADVVGHRFWDTPWWSHSVAEQERLRHAVLQAAGGIAVRFEATHIDGQGAAHAAAFSLRPIRDRDGQVLFLIPEGLDITELRRVQSDLADVIHSMPGVAFQFRVDANGSEKLTFVSDSVEHMFGLRAADLTRDLDGVRARIPEDSQLAIREAITRSAASGNLVDVEFRAIAADGTQRLVRIQSVPRREHDGSISWNGVLTDLTESRRLERELTETEARFQEVLRAAPIGVHLYRLESGGRLIFSGGNPAGERILGINHAPLIGKTIEECFPQIVGMGIPDKYRRICSEGGAWSSDQLVVEDGDVRGIFEVHAFSIGPGRCAVMFSEVSVRQQAQHALKESERRFRAFVDNAVEGIILVEFNPPVAASESASEQVRLGHMHGVIIECNHAAARLYGFTDRQALIGLRWADFATKFHAAATLSHPASSTNAGDHGLEYAIVDSNGERRILCESGFDEVMEGHIVRHWSLLRDVTELRRSQESMLRARQIAENASRAKGDFLANMSHEIRTPLNAIAGLGKLLVDSELDEEQRGILGMLRNATAALTSIVNDILDFSRIEAGKLPILRQEFDLKETLCEALGMVSIPAAERELELDFQYPGDAPTRFVGDPARLRQIVLNLLTNAVKFADAGSVRLLVECAQIDVGDARLLISVADTGPGIDASKLAHIFEPFVQIDTSITRPHAGLGLGLSISRRLAVMMGGTINVESVPDRGSVFTLSLPLQLASPAEPAAACDPAEASFQNARILLVEDNYLNHRVARLLLERMGCQVDSAMDGVRAVEMASARDYDVVLMDCQMPVLDGLSATRQIRAQAGELRRVPIIALTAHALDSHRRECLAAGMDDYLSKPIDWAELQRLLSRWCAVARI